MYAWNKYVCLHKKDEVMNRSNRMFTGTDIGLTKDTLARQDKLVFAGKGRAFDQIDVGVFLAQHLVDRLHETKQGANTVEITSKRLIALIESCESAINAIVLPDSEWEKSKDRGEEDGVSTPHWFERGDYEYTQSDVVNTKKCLAEQDVTNPSNENVKPIDVGVFLAEQFLESLFEVRQSVGIHQLFSAELTPERLLASIKGCESAMDAIVLPDDEWEQAKVDRKKVDRRTRLIVDNIQTKL